MKRLRLLPLLLAVPCWLASGCRPPAKAASGTDAVPTPAPFVENAAAAGLDFVQRSGLKRSLDIVQTSAGGCALFDFDGDGWLDVFLVQGKHTAGTGGGNRLYRNTGGGKFEDVTERAGVRGHGYGLGCAVGDFNADGHPDLFVCNNGTSELYRNRGDGTFAEEGAQLGAAVRGCSVHAVFADLDGDRWPDMYVARYVQLNAHSKLECTLNGVPSSCDPQAYPAEPGVFLKNLGGKKFADRTQALGLINDGRGMSSQVADLNEDGRLDLFVTNDTTANALFLSQPGGGFKNAAMMSGVAYGDLGVAEANMGSDLGDVDGDGKLDLVVGVLNGRASLLFRNQGKALFSLESRSSGLYEPTLPMVTWGAGFLDYDNDGDLDLFQANGHTHNLAAQITPGQQYEQPRQLFENDGQGKFTDRTAEAGPALQTSAAGRGAAFGDVDNDGDVDVLVNNLDGPPLLLLNQAERRGNHWLRVKLVGAGSNPLPEGAAAELKVGGKRLLRHLHTSYSYASANDSRLHFGLGAETSVGPLSIHWPDGKRTEVPVPGVDREITVRQP